jgi:hypothetical protein
MVRIDLCEFAWLTAVFLLACSEGLRFLFRESTEAAALKHNNVVMSLRTIFTILVGGGDLDSYYERNEVQQDRDADDWFPISFPWAAMALIHIGIALVLLNLLIAMVRAYSRSSAVGSLALAL